MKSTRSRDGRAGRFVLAAFDMDGTLIENDSSWLALHKHFGTVENGREGLKLYTESKIDYDEFMRRDIAAWPKGVTIREIEEVISRYRIRREAPATVARLKERGVKVAIVSSGIDVLAEMVARELGIDRWIANGFTVDSRGRLRGVGRVDPTRKDVAYLKMLRRLNVDGAETIAVGDTVYDLAFLKSAGLGFFLSEDRSSPDPSIIGIEKLTDIFDHL